MKLISLTAVIAASLALTLGFACALPLAAFAAISALMFDAGLGVAAMLTIWGVNQVAGFLVLHYPLDVLTLAWGLVLGGLGLAALFAARAVPAYLSFLAAFVAYEGGLYVIDVPLGFAPASFDFADVARILAINVAAYGVMLAVRALAPKSAAKLAHA